MSLLELQQAAGGRVVSTDGSAVVHDYGDPFEEWRVVRTSAGVLSRDSRACIGVSGPDSAAWLQGMVAGDVRSVADGGPTLVTVIADATGHIVADVRVVSRAGGFLLDLPRRQVAEALALLDGFIISEDVELQDLSTALTCLTAQGAGVGTDALRAAIPGALTIAAADHTGEGGADLYAEADALGAVWNGLLAVGAAPVGSAAAEVLRVEAGIGVYGQDFDSSVLAPEAGLPDGAISYAKGCYVGQEVIARIHARGHTNRSLTGLVAPPGAVVSVGAALAVHAEGEDRAVGQVTSVVHSYALDRPIALAMVRNEARTPGTVVRAAHEGAFVELEVAALPFVGCGL